MRLGTLVVFIGLMVGCEPSDKEEGFPVSSSSQQETPSTEADCTTYRQEYPQGPYGTSVGSVVDDFLGMVDGNGTSQSLTDVYADTSKRVLVIVNAFDT